MTLTKLEGESALIETAGADMPDKERWTESRACLSQVLSGPQLKLVLPIIDVAMPFYLMSCAVEIRCNYCHSVW